MRSVTSALRLMMQVRKDLLGLLSAGFREYGDVWELDVLGRRQLMVLHPSAVKAVLYEHADCFVKGKDYTDRRKGLAKFVGSGLLTSNGDLWKRQRRLVAPALHGKRIPSYVEAMVAAAERAAGRWSEGETLAIDHEMSGVTLEIVSRTLFSTDIGPDAARIAACMDTLQGMIEANNSAATVLPAWFPTPQRLRESRAVRTLDEIVYPLIRKRRPTLDAIVEDTGDLCSMLLLARDEDGAPMDDEQARDEIATMFLAGHDTTANTLNWAWALLARSPEAERALHDELDTVLGGRAPTADDVRQLPWTEAVVKETLRLYPPVFTFMRSCVKHTTVGGHEVPPGVDVSLFPWATQRDARFFEDPTSFRPERFAGKEQPDRFTWFPFGAGPRICAGGMFAMTEAIVVLAVLAQRFRLRLAPGQEAVPEPGVTLRPRGPLQMSVESRSQS